MWVRDEALVWDLATAEKFQGSTLTLRMSTSQEQRDVNIHAEGGSVFPSNPDNDKHFDDMTQMHHINEPTILRNLELRALAQDKGEVLSEAYTYISEVPPARPAHCTCTGDDRAAN